MRFRSPIGYLALLSFPLYAVWGLATVALLAADLGLVPRVALVERFVVAGGGVSVVLGAVLIAVRVGAAIRGRLSA